MVNNMGKRFVSRKNKGNVFIKLIIIVTMLYFILNYFINKINGTIDDALVSKLLLNVYSNNLNYDFSIDLNDPEVILSTALNFNDVIKLEKKEEEKLVFKENKIYQVYIYNTHQTEEYDAGSLANYNIDLTVYTASNILKTKLDTYNIDAYVENKSVKEYLNKYGFNYNQSYKVSREFLESAPDDIDLYIDLHRDSAGKDITTAVINDKSYAKVMFVVGTNFENYNLNMELATKLNNIFIDFNPNITRGIFTRHSVYNQDFSSNVVLLELGGPYNTLEEIENTLDVLADVINSYFGG